MSAQLRIPVLLLALIALGLGACGNMSTNSSTPASPPQPGTATPTVGSMLAQINLIRRHAHLKRLKLDQAASLLADAHSKSMAQTGRLVPVPNKDIDPFVHNGRKGGVYQVVVSFTGGSPPSTGRLVSYMESTHHGRARTRGFLNPSHNRIGLGVARRPSSLWATAIFITVPR